MDLSFNYLGANTVILQTVPINNNAQTMTELVNVNQRIWKFAKDFELNQTKTSQIRVDDPGSNSSTPAQRIKRRLIVMDMYSYSIFMFLRNSIEIGLIDRRKGDMIQAELLDAGDPFRFLNLTESSLQGLFDQKRPLRRYWGRGNKVKKDGRFIDMKVGHTCGDINCTTQSSITREGTHWCMGETAGRINAGLACLVHCSLSDDGHHDDSEFKFRLRNATISRLRDCEKRCNDKYMTLVPIPWENASRMKFNGTVYKGFENY